MNTPSRIPEDILVLFRSFAAQAPPLIKKLSDALGRSPVHLSFAELLADVSDSIGSMNPEDVRDVLRLVAFAYSLELNLGLTSSEATQLIAQRAVLFAGTESEPTFRAAGERLADVLRNAHAINLLARADDLAAELPNRCEDIRIVTDIRPIFGEGVTNTPNAGILLHTLRITYVDGERQSQVYFSLDGKDLIQLDGQVRRAMDKQKSLEAILRNTPITIIKSGTA